MTLPKLLIFYVSKWKNNKKHWKIGIWRHCDVIIGRGKSKLGVGLLCTEMIIVCKFHDPSIIGSRDTEGGSEEPPPVTDWPKKPSLNSVNLTTLIFNLGVMLFLEKLDATLKRLKHGKMSLVLVNEANQCNTRIILDPRSKITLITKLRNKNQFLRHSNLQSKFV